MSDHKTIIAESKTARFKKMPSRKMAEDSFAFNTFTFSQNKIATKPKSAPSFAAFQNQNRYDIFLNRQPTNFSFKPKITEVKTQTSQPPKETASSQPQPQSVFTKILSATVAIKDAVVDDFEKGASYKPDPAKETVGPSINKALESYANSTATVSPIDGATKTLLKNEKVRNYISGIFAGNFNEQQSYSQMAADILISTPPVVGTIMDIRDAAAMGSELTTNGLTIKTAIGVALTAAAFFGLDFVAKPLKKFGTDSAVMRFVDTATDTTRKFFNKIKSTLELNKIKEFSGRIFRSRLSLDTSVENNFHYEKAGVFFTKGADNTFYALKRASEVEKERTLQIESIRHTFPYPEHDVPNLVDSMTTNTLSHYFGRKDRKSILNSDIFLHQTRRVSDHFLLFQRNEQLLYKNGQTPAIKLRHLVKYPERFGKITQDEWSKLERHIDNINNNAHYIKNGYPETFNIGDIGNNLFFYRDENGRFSSILIDFEDSAGDQLTFKKYIGADGDYTTDKKTLRASYDHLKKLGFIID